jgi:aryl-alcohol dehydrogenase-like predicted oxidoreductase
VHSVGGTQKGDIVKELMKTCYDNGINMFDVGLSATS